MNQKKIIILIAKYLRLCIIIASIALPIAVIFSLLLFYRGIIDSLSTIGQFGMSFEIGFAMVYGFSMLTALSILGIYILYKVMYWIFKTAKQDIKEPEIK